MSEKKHELSCLRLQSYGTGCSCGAEPVASPQATRINLPKCIDSECPDAPHVGEHAQPAAGTTPPNRVGQAIECTCGLGNPSPAHTQHKIGCPCDLSEGTTPERPTEKVRKAREIDIKNLRFYAKLFEEHKWDTPNISTNVFPATLRDIADRIESTLPFMTAPNTHPENGGPKEIAFSQDEARAVAPVETPSNEVRFRERLKKLSFLITGNDYAFLSENPQIEEALKVYVENVNEDAAERAPVETPRKEKDND